MGISFQTATLNNPNTKFTYQCRNVIQTSTNVKDYNWRGYRYVNNTPYKNNNYIYRDGTTAASKNVIREIRNKELDSRCAEIQNKITLISNTNKLKTIQRSIKNLQKQSSRYRKDLQYIRNNYNTVLFEKIANQKESNSILSMNLKAKNAKVKYDRLQKKISDNSISIGNLQRQFSSNSLVIELYEYIKVNKDGIKNDYKKANSRHFLKRVGIMVLFLLPIALFFLVDERSKQEKKLYKMHYI